MLKGKHVDLKILEREDLAQWNEWFSDIEYVGPYLWYPMQKSRAELEKSLFGEGPNQIDMVRFIVQKKDGTKIGNAAHFIGTNVLNLVEIGYGIKPGERGKGYASEVAQILVDYVFMTKHVPRVQATVSVENLASQKVLEMAGFKREGTMRKVFNHSGRWVDGYLYSILREEWNKPRVLTMTG